MGFSTSQEINCEFFCCSCVKCCRDKFRVFRFLNTPLNEERSKRESHPGQNKSDGTLREIHRLRSHNRLDRECAVNVLTPPTAKASTFSAYLVDCHYPLSCESVKPPARLTSMPVVPKAQLYCHQDPSPN
jgi:hypothetical protein